MWDSRRPERTVRTEGARHGVVTTGGGVIHVRTDMDRRAPIPDIIET